MTLEEILNHKGETVPNKCAECKTIYEEKKSHVIAKLKKKPYAKKYGCKFCSRECYKKYKFESLHLNCNNCSNIFYKRKSEIKKSKSGNHFCSRSCAATYNNKNKTYM